MKVQCKNCNHYKLLEELTREPKGWCKNNDALPLGVYLGTNWRLGQRSSETPRYCKEFKEKVTE